MIDKKKRGLIINIIGYFLLIAGLIRILQVVLFLEPIHVFWICNHVPFLMGLAIVLRKPLLLMVEFLFLFLGQIAWDFFFLFGPTLNNTNNQIFTILAGEGVIGGAFAITIHFITLPLALIAILLLAKPNKNAWLFGLWHVLALAPIVLYFGSEYNLNCFFRPCVNLSTFPLYQVVLIVGYFAVMKLLNIVLDWSIKKFNKLK